MGDMIPDFKEYVKISESLWKKGIERSKTGEDRIEDKIQTNISEMKEVDMGNPYLNFADIDLEINGENMFTWEEYLKYKEYINSTEWRLPVENSLFKNDWFDSDRIDYTKDEFDNGDILCSGTCKKTGQTLSFLIEEKYLYNQYMVDNNYDPDSYYGKTCVCLWIVGGSNFGRKEVAGKIGKYKIRLVKYKR